MRRRDFITLLSGTAISWPLAARAQQHAKLPVVGFLSAASADLYVKFLGAFRRGLNEMGFVEGQNVVVEYRWANGHYDRLPDLAADLVRRQVTVMATSGTIAALTAKAATKTIPIVFTTGSDPVEVGLVASVGQPGGNVTGTTNLNMTVTSKRPELLHELLPKATAFALLVNPANAVVAEAETRAVQTAARTLGLQLHILQASTEAEIDSAVASLAQLRAGGLVISTGDAFFNSVSAYLGAVTLRHAVPTIYHGRDFVAAGGLVGYGGSVVDSYHLAGIYAGRILTGEKPADLPVLQSTKVEMFINLKTAKAFGITIPLPLSGRADEVIE